MVCWHHYSGGGGNFTHTSDHGIFFEIGSAINYAVALVQHVEAEMKQSLDANVLNEDGEWRDLNDLSCGWDSQELNLVDKSGRVLFSQFSRWSISKELMQAEMCFDYATADEIRQAIKAALKPAARYVSGETA